MTKLVIKNVQSDFSSDDYKILDQKTVFQGFFKINKYKVSHRLFEGGWSGDISREILERGDAAVLFLYDYTCDALVLVEQFRAGALRTEANPWLIEAVAGMIKPGEDPIDVACREAKEEADIDVKPEQLEYMLEYLTSPGGTCEKLYLYIAPVDASVAGGCHGLLEEEGEDIRVVVVQREQAMDMLSQGKIVNAATVIGLQWLALNRQRLVNKWQAMPETSL